MIPQALVAECQSVVVALKRAFRKMDVHEVKSICNTASIEILLADTPERKAARSGGMLKPGWNVTGEQA